MRHAEASKMLKPFAIVTFAGALCLAAAMFVAALTFAAQRAEALPAYAQQTGKACGYCHVNPAGGGKLTGNGSKFQKNGHKL
jgi:hypothetical protein